MTEKARAIPLPQTAALEVADLRVADLLTFLAVVRSSSLTAAARERKVTPSQVSKAITRVETHFARKLVERGSRGVLLSEAGRTLAPALEAIVTQLEAARGATQEGAEIQLGAPSYLQAALLPALAASATNVRIRAFELPPSLLRANAQDDAFDVLLLPGGTTHLPASWVAHEVGAVKKSLFGSPALEKKLGRLPLTPERLADVPFVMPTYKQQGRVVPVDDDCPLPRRQRRVGHQVQTILVGLDVAAATDQLIFGPVIAAHRHVATGVLVEIPVVGWAVSEPLSFACNVDRVSVRLQSAFDKALRAAMS
ncbi:MAG: LysR family transcriptional regulator [Labilithrix sp.]|nr:LysR family transcriptional regulator [Labilithrix sp.]